MKKSSVLILTLTIFFCSCGSAPLEVQNSNSTLSEQPNVVLILSDDQRADDLGSMPNLAALTEEATNFTHAYVTTPLCCPSRSSILTGEYAHNHGVLGNTPPYGFEAFSDSVTLATWLQDAGYTTALIGKYLNGYADTKGKYVPPGWDTFMAFVKGPNYTDYTLKNFVDGVDEGILKYASSEEDYSTEVLTQDAVDFLTATESEDEQPFFLYFTPYAPHAPATPPDEYKDLVANIDPTSAPSYNETDVSDKSSWVKDLPPLSVKDEAQLKTYGQLTAGALKSLDDGIGQIIDTLKANGELENTLIIYMSDNGLQWGEHRIALSKNAPYEESVHIPLVIYDGRAPAGKTVDEFVLNIDLAPTLLEWAGVPIPDSVDGKSLRSLLEGQSEGWRASFLTEAWAGREGVTFNGVHEGQWSYIDYGDGEIELYDLQVDPYQLDNLAQDDAYADTLKKLQAELARLKECKGETCS